MGSFSGPAVRLDFDIPDSFDESIEFWRIATNYARGANSASCRPDDVPGVVVDTGFEAVAEFPDPESADAGIEGIGERPVVKGDVDVLGKPVDDSVNLRKGGAALNSPLIKSAPSDSLVP